MGVHFSAWIVYVNATVQVLINQLGDGRFLARQQATKQLIAIVQSDEGHMFFPLLETATRHPNLEISSRASTVLAHYIQPTNYGQVPWIDMLPYKTNKRQELIKKYVDRAHAERIQADGSPWWSDYRHATRLYIYDLIRSGWSRSRIHVLLQEMVANELKYKSMIRKWYSP